MVYNAALSTVQPPCRTPTNRELHRTLVLFSVFVSSDYDWSTKGKLKPTVELRLRRIHEVQLIMRMHMRGKHN